MLLESFILIGSSTSGMFRKKRIDTGKIDTLIGKDTEFQGTLNAKGTVRIDGKFEGDIKAEGNIIVGETGQVSAEIKARNLSLSGQIKGNVTLQEKLEICSSGKLSGDINVGLLVVEEGAFYQGKSTMTPRAGKKESITENKK